MINSKKKKIKEVKKEELVDWLIPKINFTPPRALTNKELAETTKSQCLRPDIFLTNGRHCEGCQYIELCNNRIKILPSHSKKNKSKAF